MYVINDAYEMVFKKSTSKNRMKVVRSHFGSSSTVLKASATHLQISIRMAKAMKAKAAAAAPAPAKKAMKAKAKKATKAMKGKK